MWSGFCLFFLYSGRFSPLLDLLPSNLRPKGVDDGSVSVMVYFFQMAAIAVPTGKQKLADDATRFLCILGQVAGLQQVPNWSVCTGEEDENSGVCIMEGVSATAIMAWPIAIPIILSLLLFCIVKLMHQISNCARPSHRQFTQASDSGHECSSALHVASASSWPNPLTQPTTARGSRPLLLDCDDATPQQGGVAGGSINQQMAEGECPQEVSQTMNAQEQEPSGRHGQQTMAGASDGVSQAVVKMLLFSYGGFVDTVFRLLNCVPVCTAVRAGGLYSQTSDCTQTTSVLFYAGGEECGGWHSTVT